MILSLSPNGTATSGSVYVVGRDHTQWVVRVLRCHRTCPCAALRSDDQCLGQCRLTWRSAVEPIAAYRPDGGTVSRPIASGTRIGGHQRVGLGSSRRGYDAFTAGYPCRCSRDRSSGSSPRSGSSWIRCAVWTLTPTSSCIAARSRSSATVDLLPIECAAMGAAARR